jgi:hypothetical protein
MTTGGAATEWQGPVNPTCKLEIDEETVSPGGGSLPVRNPAKIRTGFAPVFEVKHSKPTCPITWSIPSGPGTIIGSTSSTLVTVRGDSVGTVQLRAATSGGLHVDVNVPVVNQQTVNVKGFIVRKSNGSEAATTVQRVEDDIETSNLIWVQCGIQFNLQSTNFIDNTGFHEPDFNHRADLRDTHSNTGAIEVYYVKNFPDISATGATTQDGIVIRNAGNGRTSAHELGHGMGLLDAGTQDLRLMHGTFSTLKADIALAECNGLTRFTSD